ncbi:MAG: alginate lyase family protein [Gemmatimonadaceae bacterium]|jgi:hypothetical protein|nr:alginate lyase family protein [Gemmatimonadaceae bacterium]
MIRSLVSAAVGAWLLSYQVAHAQPERPLQVIVSRADVLLAAQAASRAGAPGIVPARDRLLRDVERLASQPMVAVTDKRTHRAPSGDPHDYLSLSPYWWPDSTKSDGLPYIRRDGVTNPESKADLDQPRIEALGDRVQRFTLAWWLTGDRRWSTLAAQQIRTWFTDSATRMTPHLKYAQLIRGTDKIRGTGIIDSRRLIEVVDAIGLLQRSPDWTPQDDAAVKGWFRSYVQWMWESPHGAYERAAKNNHGSWYGTQMAVFSLFVGDTARAREMVRAAQRRVDTQIARDGVQAEEMTRTRSMHYSLFNLEALSLAAEVGRVVGVDLWGHVAPSGASLTVGLEHVAKYVGKESQWPGQQLEPVRATELLRAYRRAGLALDAGLTTRVLAALPTDVASKDVSVVQFWTAR